MTKRRALTNVRTRRWRLIMAAGARGSRAGHRRSSMPPRPGWDRRRGQPHRRRVPSSTRSAALSGAIGADGDFSEEPNASAVPFLGGAPGTLLSGLFDEFGDFPAVEDINVGPDDVVEALDDQVRTAFGEAVAPTREYICGRHALRPQHQHGQGTDRDADPPQDRGWRASERTSRSSPSACRPSASCRRTRSSMSMLDWTVNATLIADAERAPPGARRQRPRTRSRRRRSARRSRLEQTTSSTSAP